MKKFLETHPTADVAGVEYLAKAKAKWPAPARQRRPGSATTPTPTAVDVGIRYRAESGKHQWLGLLTWTHAT